MAGIKEKLQDLKKEILVRKIKKTSDEGQQILYAYLLQARVGVGKELNEVGSEEVPGITSEIWKKATEYSDKLIKVDRQKALELGVTLSLLPKNTENEKKYQWFRGDGPVILARPELRGNLQNFLDSGEMRAQEFFSTIKKYMAFDITKMKSKEETFETPDCYLAVTCLYLGTQVEDLIMSDRANFLSQTATEKLENPEVARVVDYYRDSTDTAWLPEALAPFLVKN